MATERARLPHEERTADEPRDPNLHTVILQQIKQLNSNIKLFTLSAKDTTQGISVRQHGRGDIHMHALTILGISKVLTWPMA